MRLLPNKFVHTTGSITLRQTCHNLSDMFSLLKFEIRCSECYVENTELVFCLRKAKTDTDARRGNKAMASEKDRYNSNDLN